MSHFDKFMKDIELKRAREKKKMESIKRDENEHLQRHRVRVYSERWQNSIRWIPRSEK